MTIVLRMNIPRVFLGLTLAAMHAVGASLSVYIGAPGESRTSLSGAATETFDELPSGPMSSPLDSGIGRYQLSMTSVLSIQDADDFGGANFTKYAAFGAQSNTAAPVTLTLTANSNYFGFWWSAGDANNGITLYNDNVLLTRVSASDLTTFLAPNLTITSVNGKKTYDTDDYSGNPNWNRNRPNYGERYAYVHLLTSGASFNRVAFDNSGKLGTGFESDNHSVIRLATAVTGTDVFVRQIAITADAPDASTLVYVVTGVVLLAFGRVRTTVR